MYTADELTRLHVRKFFQRWYVIGYDPVTDQAVFMANCPTEAQARKALDRMATGDSRPCQAAGIAHAAGAGA